MFNNRKFNSRYIRQPTLQSPQPAIPLWIDFLILLLCAGLCAGAGWGGLAMLNSIK